MMTPALLAQHEAHKARLRRFEQAAVKHAPPLTRAPDAIEATPAPCKRRRQYETAHHPVPLSLPSRIIRVVAREFGISVADLLSKQRQSCFSIPRFVAVGIMLEMTDMSLPAIGRQLGNRDHTTVLNARKKAKELFASEAFRNRVDQLKAEIGA